MVPVHLRRLALAAALLAAPACGDDVPPLPHLPVTGGDQVRSVLESSLVDLSVPDGVRPPTVGMAVAVPGDDGDAVHVLLGDDATGLSETISLGEDRVETFSVWQLWSPAVELMRVSIASGLAKSGAIIGVSSVGPATQTVVDPTGVIMSTPPIDRSGVTAIGLYGNLIVEYYEPPSPGKWGRLVAEFDDITALTADTASPPRGLPDLGNVTAGIIAGRIDVPVLDPSDRQFVPEFQDVNLNLRRAYPIETADADVWGAGQYAFVAANRFRTMDPTFMIFDTKSDAAEPIATVTGAGRGKDIKFERDHLFVAVEGTDDSPGGVRVYDIERPDSPEQVAFITSDRLGRRGVHNVFVEKQHVYATAGRLGIEIWDVTNPAQPSFVAHWGFDGQRPGVVHDVAVIDDVLYLSALSGGVYIIDVADPANPTELGWITYDNPFAHNAWPTSDGTHLLVTDEYVGAPVRVFDITDPSTPRAAGTIPRPRRNAIAHNVFVTGDYATIAYYLDGVEVWDISDINQPERTGRYQTIRDQAPTLSLDFENALGVFGVWPFGDDGSIYVSDSYSGLLVLQRTQ